eukprot:m.282971 g.282971  ORF g.282971 m.282971 type:complete len:130 (+) comp127421_c0_seq1:96-485(+)
MPTKATILNNNKRQQTKWRLVYINPALGVAFLLTCSFLNKKNKNYNIKKQTTKNNPTKSRQSVLLNKQRTVFGSRKNLGEEIGMCKPKQARVFPGSYSSIHSVSFSFIFLSFFSLSLVYLLPYLLPPSF